VLAHGLTLQVFCPGRCSIGTQVRMGRRGPVMSAATRLRGRDGVGTLIVRLSQAVRSRLASVRTALLYVTVKTRAGGLVRTVTLVVRWTRAGVRGS
jgi:hypothetical protein